MKFIIKISLFCLLLIAAYIFFIDKLSKGYVDQYYNKFTQEAGGLIIGLSRANEGISPYILEEELNNRIIFTKPIINFAINEAHFGEIYHEAIKKKITSINRGVFIISISPGNFTAPFNLDDNQILEFDKKLKMGKINNLTSSPNYNYIIKTYGKPLYNSLYQIDKWSHRISHSNGWNEIALNAINDTITEDVIKLWKSQNLKFYMEKANTEQFAPYRHKWFIKTLKHLITKGSVILVRMPSDIDILELENKHWKTFNIEFDSIARNYRIPYFNYSKQSNYYKTYDGSHMVSESAKEFTKQLSLDIIEHLKEK